MHIYYWPRCTSAKDLACKHAKVNIWSIAVVRHTCRVIYITSPSQNLKKSRKLSRSDPREPIPCP